MNYTIMYLYYQSACFKQFNLHTLQGSIKFFMYAIKTLADRSTVKFDKQARGPKFIKSVTVKQFMLFLKCLYQTWVLLFKRGECDV